MGMIQQWLQPVSEDDKHEQSRLTIAIAIIASTLGAFSIHNDLADLCGQFLLIPATLALLFILALAHVKLPFFATLVLNF